MGHEYRGVVSMGSHAGVLAAAMYSATGPVLELGCGVYSTPLIHWLAGAMRLPVITIDADLAWLERMAVYRCDWHRFEHCPRPSQHHLLGMPCGAALVDNDAADRGPCLRRLHHARLIVVHDTEPVHMDQYDGLTAAMGEYAYRLDVQVLKEFRNQVTLLSDHINVAESFGGLLPA